MQIGEVFKSFEHFLVCTCEYAIFQFWRLKEIRRFGDYKFPYREEIVGKRIYVLANGPSLNNEIDTLKSDATFKSSPKVVVNFFIDSVLFKELKPDYYCLADPIFFKSDKYTSLFDKISSEVSWPMTLIVPNWGEAIVKSRIHNSNINILSISPLRYRGYDSLRYRYYKSGKGMPCYVNVTIMIEFVLLNLGCKDIWLYGVDHSFLADLSVNDENQLCTVDSHFYGEKKLRVINMKSDGRVRHMKDFVYDKYLTFLEHEKMRGYADYLGARIVNCTKDSWIDAYVRLAQLEKGQA